MAIPPPPNVALSIENDENETKLHGEYDYECIRNSLSTYPLFSW